MTAQTRLSAKGQVVIPKDVRDRLGLKQGEDFEVFGRGDEVVLRRLNGRRADGSLQAVQQAVREIQSVYHYAGPPVTDRMIDDGIRQAVRRKFSGNSPSK